MSISINSKLNIAFTGMQEDIQVSRQIVKNFRKKLGKPHSNTYVDVMMRGHEDNPKFAEIKEKLEAVRQKYYKQVTILRNNLNYWINTQKLVFPENYSELMEKLKQLIFNTNAANCEKVAKVIQYEHLKKGIEMHNFSFSICDKDTGKFRDHVFSLRNLPKVSDHSNPETWGEAVLVDCWAGSGIVDQAVRPKGLVKKGALNQLLEFFKFNQDKETVSIYPSDTVEAASFMRYMKYGK